MILQTNRIEVLLKRNALREDLQAYSLLRMKLKLNIMGIKQKDSGLLEKREMIDKNYIEKFYWETYPSFSSPTLTPRKGRFPWNEDQPNYGVNEICVYYNTSRYAYLAVLLCKNDIRIRTYKW